jgi:2-polyprenyl-6-methoxyphenol hydroxylase-like FAD-dependent oxidoreductase
MLKRFDRVLIAGSGCAGMAFAKVLSRYAQEVLVVDPAVTPAAAKNPQDAHAHVLLGAGTDALLRLFPDLEFAGMSFPRLVDPGLRLKWVTPYGPMATSATGIRTLIGHRRQLLEAMHRSLARTSNIRFVEGLAAEVAYDYSTKRFSATIKTSAAQCSLSSDLFLDATGWQSASVNTAVEQGWIGLEEESFDSNIAYSSVTVVTDKKMDWDMLMANASPPKIKRSAIALKHAENTYVLTMCGLLGERTPRRNTEISAFIQGLKYPGDIIKLLDGAHVSPKVDYYRNGSNRIRRVQVKTKVPYFLVGDGIARLSPYHGFGLSMALFQAETMQSLLEQGFQPDPALFYSATDKALSRLVRYVRGTELDWQAAEQLGQDHVTMRWHEDLLWKAAAKSQNHAFANILRGSFHLKYRPSKWNKASLSLSLALFSVKEILKKCSLQLRGIPWRKIVPKYSHEAMP